MPGFTSVRQQGFTLLEMMLVVLLIGAIALTVKIFVADNPLRQETQRLTTALRWAAQQTERDGRIYGLSPAQKSWQLMVLTRQPNGQRPSYYWPGYYWHPLKASPLKFRSLPAALSLQLTQTGTPVELPVGQDEARWQDPKVLLFPGGEYSAAELSLLDENGVQHHVWPPLPDPVMP
ncbi:TPA: prepilin-type N-terminal cleavage/methylation domain-containing protein [Serratia odorifera]|nr:prepilin-type N-terminal cleavage/methylation domain-containing protein [Serratia odorifera]